MAPPNNSMRLKVIGMMEIVAQGDPGLRIVGYQNIKVYLDGFYKRDRALYMLDMLFSSSEQLGAIVNRQASRLGIGSGTSLAFLPGYRSLPG